MKKKVVAYAALSVLGVALVSQINFAEARGFFWDSPEDTVSKATQMFETRANLLGISVDEVKNAWSEGKSLKELAVSKGIDETTLQTRLQEVHKMRMESHLQALVDAGTITEAQKTSRLNFMNQMHNESKSDKGMNMHRRFMF